MADAQDFSSPETLRKIAKDISKGLGDKDFLQLVSDNDMIGAITDWIHTGNYALDYIISGRADGSGGIPVGRVTEFFGEPGSGKSLIGFHMAAEVQRRGGIAILLDTESAYNKFFGSVIGIDNDKLIYAEPVTVEEVAKILEEVMKIAMGPDKPLIFLFWDGIGATSTKHETGTDFDKRDMQRAQEMHKLFRRYKKDGRISQTRLAFVATNFVTSKIGVMFGPDTVSPGGRGYKFASSLRLEINPSSKLKEIIVVDGKKKEGKKVVGVKARCYVAKSRVWHAHRQVKIDIFMSSGIDPYSGLLDLLVDEEIVRKKGGGYCDWGEEAFRTVNKQIPREWVEAHPEIIEELHAIEMYKVKEEDEDDDRI